MQSIQCSIVGIGAGFFVQVLKSLTCAHSFLCALLRDVQLSSKAQTPLVFIICKQHRIAVMTLAGDRNKNLKKI